MGQKINPIGFRLGINRTWDSRWFADNAEYGQLLHEDLKIRAYLMEELKSAGIAKVVIERPHKKCRVTIHSARPGLIIGKKGADIEKLRRKLSEMTNSETHLNIVEVRKPGSRRNARCAVDRSAARAPVAFRRAMKASPFSAGMRPRRRSIKITCAGVFGGAGNRPYRMVSLKARSAAYAARRHRLRHGRSGKTFRYLRVKAGSSGRNPLSTIDGFRASRDRE